LDINALYKKTICGDKSAEEALFSALSERFEQFAYQRIWDKEDSRDVLQDTLLVIAREYRQIEFETSFSAWAYKVLDNRILAYMKRKQSRQGRTEVGADSRGSQNRAEHVNPDLRLRLLDCLRKVGEVNRRHARILDLHYHGYTTEEICHRLKTTRNSFYIALHRARRMLETCLKTGDIDQ
jgi:RNA polymerase sigma factor (sigma-70 family)